ncbi:protein translocase subunit SecF [Clostridium sp. 'White wine YQ']|uniref:protein translocase subunit SecF n=1 Tax=Clostridium sp. 'White wine YQ' TaxID=3027474 RepID=UPI002364FCA1|nr:protein translocase subunit SecF [Clostridium sp. 'White wine YQ']MDD7794049.1 protein translocase subunit SecF [Clostridium sp. 'White wine YQ']
MLKIIEKTKIWFTISLIIMLIGAGFMIYRGGLNLGLDFKGGTQVDIKMPKDFNKGDVDTIVKKYAEDAVTNTVSETVDGSTNEVQIEIKSKSLDSTKVSDMFKELSEKYSLKQDALVSHDEIGPSIGNELTSSAIKALAVAVIAMLIYIAIRFEFKFGLAAIIALFHDILITLSIYAIFNIPVNSPFIAAILTIIGYSINDTIVIFDRIRENQKSMRRNTPIEIADHSLTQTFTRSLNTTLTTLLTTTAVNVFVPSVREFAFPLVVGMACGAYSSIFIASPVWVMLKNRTSK